MNVLAALLLVIWSLAAAPAVGAVARKNTGRMRRLRSTLLVNGLQLRALTEGTTALLSDVITKPVTKQAVATAAAATICGYFHHSIQGLRADNKDLKAELKADIKELKADLKADIKKLKADLKADIKELKDELRGDLAEFKGVFKELNAQIRMLMLIVVGTSIVVLHGSVARPRAQGGQ